MLKEGQTKLIPGTSIIVLHRKCQPAYSLLTRLAVGKEIFSWKQKQSYER